MKSSAPERSASISLSFSSRSERTITEVLCALPLMSAIIPMPLALSLAQPSNTRS